MGHIPGGDTAALELLGFDEALAASLLPREDYDVERWLYVPNVYSEYRYVLDGDYGGGTKAALLQFQRKSGLAADGVCGAQSWARLL